MHVRSIAVALLLVASPVRAEPTAAATAPTGTRVHPIVLSTGTAPATAAATPTSQVAAVVASAADAGKLAATVPGAPAWLPWVTFAIAAALGTAGTIVGIVEAPRLGQ